MSFIFSLPILSLLPFFVGIILFFLSMFIHLNFKLISIKTVQTIMALLGGLFGFSFFVSISRLHIENNVSFMDMHFLFAFVMFGLTIVLNFISGRFKGTLLEIVGLVIFFGAAFFLLA